MTPTYSVSSDPLEIEPELTMDHPLDKLGQPLWFVTALVNKLVPWCAWLLSGALEITRLRLCNKEWHTDHHWVQWGTDMFRLKEYRGHKIQSHSWTEHKHQETDIYMQQIKHATVPCRLWQLENTETCHSLMPQQRSHGRRNKCTGRFRKMQQT